MKKEVQSSTSCSVCKFLTCNSLTTSDVYGLRGDPLLLRLRLLLLLLPFKGLLGLLDILLGPLLGLGDRESEDDLPLLSGGLLRGEADLDRERPILRTGERLRRRPTGDLLGGLRARLGGGERRRGGKGDRLRTGLPRILRGDPLTGDLGRLDGDGDRPLGDTGRLLFGDSPRRYGDSLRIGESPRRRGGGSILLGEPPLRTTGDLLGRGEASLPRFGPSFAASTPSGLVTSFLGGTAAALAGDTFSLGGKVNCATTTVPSI